MSIALLTENFSDLATENHQCEHHTHDLKH